MAAETEFAHPTGSILALCRIGFAALGLGDIDEAQRTLCKALEQAHASAAISLELLALSGVGAVLCELGELEQAVTMLSFALGHEQRPPAYSLAARLDDLVDQTLAAVASTSIPTQPRVPTRSVVSLVEVTERRDEAVLVERPLSSNPLIRTARPVPPGAVFVPNRFVAFRPNVIHQQL